MSQRRVGRRLFLAGTGGFSLAIPFLPSLVGRGEAQGPEAPHRFVGMAVRHGGVRHENMWPADSAATDVTTVLGNHNIHHSPLAPRMEGGDAVFSNVLRASASLLTPQLISKMNFLRGLDVPWYCSHGTHCLGSYGDLTRPTGDNGTLVPDRVSIDQVMAYSSAVYASEPRKRTLAIGQAGTSVTWDNASQRNGGVHELPTATGTRALFDEIYSPPPTEPEAPRPPVVDRVLESYNRLHSGAHGPGARLGAEDRNRLDAYMEQLYKIEAALNATTAASCGDVVVPTTEYRGRGAVYTEHASNPEWYGPNIYGLYNDVIVAAFMCDSSRIAVLETADDFHGSMDSMGGFHGVAHTADDQPESERALQRTNRNFFQMVFLDLISKMDSVVDANGLTMLDNSAVMWTNESGPSTHNNDSQPVVMAGSSGGFFNTGLYVDYRNRNADFPQAGPGMAESGRRPGLHYYHLLGTMLHSMGVPQAEWPEGEGQPWLSIRDAVPGWLDTAHPYEDDILRLAATTSLPVIT
ncbi:MAG: DUF1552 domain-containing protein [Myxococcota bacterium]